jgi:hypothetical protein
MLILFTFIIFQLEIIDACVNYIETLQTQLDCGNSKNTSQDLLNNNEDEHSRRSDEEPRRIV